MMSGVIDAYFGGGKYEVAHVTALLAINGLTAGYGGLPIIDNINLQVAPGDVVVIIGPNGAGKSTVLKSVFALAQHHCRLNPVRG